MIKNIIIILCASFAFSLTANAHCGNCGHDGAKTEAHKKCADCKTGKCDKEACKLKHKKCADCKTGKCDKPGCKLKKKMKKEKKAA